MTGLHSSMYTNKIITSGYKNGRDEMKSLKPLPKFPNRSESWANLSDVGRQVHTKIGHLKMSFICLYSTFGKAEKNNKNNKEKQNPTEQVTQEIKYNNIVLTTKQYLEREGSKCAIFLWKGF